MRKKYDLGKAFKFEISFAKIKKPLKLANDVPLAPFPEKIIGAKNLLSLLKLKFIIIIFLVLTTILISRIFYLQIVKGEENFARASQNRLIFEKIPAPRGVIFDRKGVILASNKPIFKLENGGKTQIISKEQALELETKNLAKEAPDAGPLGTVKIDLARSYFNSKGFAHLLGYTSEISADELKKTPDYNLGDRIGKLGLEAKLENYLKGRTGRHLIEVNSKGEIVNTLGIQAPIAGKNVILTIDASLQEKVFEELKAQILKTGAAAAAAVATNPVTGEVLALVSYPTFDSELLSFGISQRELDELNSDAAKPFLNRVTAGIYPPGSIFKLVTAVASLETGKISAATQIEDVGEIFLGPFRFPNWYFICCGKKEGLVDIVRAIARSNDIFFYRVGEAVGVLELANFAKKLGLGAATGIELEEAEGLIPTPSWKEKVKGEPWFPGNTLHFAIGQGDVLATPLQLNQLTSFFANGGRLMQPFTVSKITDLENKPILTFKSKVLRENLVSQENLNLVKEGMRVAASTGGTAWPFADFKISCGAKTGTAEAGVENPHAWFTVFCPVNQPEIALTVLIEEAGEGSSVSGPVARKVLEWYFTR